MTKKRKKRSNKSRHYVDNKKFLDALIEYRTQVFTARDLNLPEPRISEYIGEVFLEMAKNISYKGNFVNYTYREDFISDGIENCVQYIMNFDPDKYEKPNPFAYFTRVILFAFIRRIKKEKKQTYIKLKIMENFDLTYEPEEHMQSVNALNSDNREFIDSYEKNVLKK